MRICAYTGDFQRAIPVSDSDTNSLTCEDPSKGQGQSNGGTKKIGFGDAEDWINLLKQDTRIYCAKNPKGTQNAAVGWVQVGGTCGHNNASVWLQTYVCHINKLRLSHSSRGLLTRIQETEDFCMTGEDAAKHAEDIAQSCGRSGDFYGYGRPNQETRQRWVEVGASGSNCQKTG